MAGQFIGSTLMSFYESLPVGELLVVGGGQIGTVPALSTLSVVHKKTGPLIQSVFTLTDLAQTVVNGTEYQGTKLYDFPEGRILVLGVTAAIAQKTTSKGCGFFLLLFLNLKS